jgi:hypothetical protein
MPSYWQTNAYVNLIAFSSDTPGSSPALQLQPAPEENYNSIFQVLKMEPFFHGARLIGTTKARCGEPGKLVFAAACLRQVRDSNPIVFQAVHPGDGDWHELEINQIIPTDVLITHLKFIVKLRTGAVKPALVSQIAVSLEK